MRPSVASWELLAAALGLGLGLGLALGLALAVAPPFGFTITHRFFSVVVCQDVF